MAKIAASESTRRIFIRSHTELRPTPLVPEIRLATADDPLTLWRDMQERAGVETALPFWAFPWAGGQALARYILDHPEVVRGKRVRDLGSGSGLVAIAAALAGAAGVIANDVEPLAATAIGLNAAANGVTLQVDGADRLVVASPPEEVILAGDMLYERALAARVLPWLQAAAAAGATALLGDPGRSYAELEGFRVVAQYDVPVSEALEDAPVKRVSVLRAPAAGPS